jgi:hypothetical protein
MLQNEEAEKGMQEKSKEFIEKGSEIYLYHQMKRQMK